jgi:MinD-like ATPase involved in chromosome partitioning or flagellar assembly
VNSVPVLTAVSDARWEADLVSALRGSDHGVTVVRRCVDLADLLAAAASGLARAVVLSADLRRLDRDALTRLAVAKVAVVGLVPAGDEPAEQRLRQLGVGQVLGHDADPGLVTAAVMAAVAELAARPAPGRPVRDLGDPATALSDPPGEPVSDDAAPDDEAGARWGRLIAVWGPTGAPGRTTVAVNVAAELAELGEPVLLIDADSYGGVVAQSLGLLDESPGLAAACRQANAGTLDVAALHRLAVEVRPGLRVLTGISRSDRWPELRPAALDVVLRLARRLASVTIADCGFCLERDEEVGYDTAAPRRNGATLAVLDAADTVLGVTGADPVSLQRYVRSLAELAEAVPGQSPLTIVNRLRKGVIGPGDPRREIAGALERYAGVVALHVIPDDPAALDAALAAGRSLAEVAPAAAARRALRDLAGSLVGHPEPPTRRRRLAGRL